MWTPAARAQLARPADPYATCLTDREWEIAGVFLPPPARCGRRRRWPMRHLLDAVLYVLRSGCAWRLLPREFPPWQTTLRWFLRLSRAGVFERMLHALVMADRERAGRDASPTAAVVDAQTVRSGGVGVAGHRGYDAAKRVVGRKRHALVDTDGRLLLAAVSPASLHDSHGGIALLQVSRRPWPFIRLCFGDGAYAGPRVAGATDITVEIVGAKPGQEGFAVQPRRWVVERTFAWISKKRRCVRDYETRPDHHEAMVHIAMIMTMSRRLARTGDW
jgi:putative transposase